MYHRILPESDSRFADEEPGMVVTPDTFRAHLEILREFFELMSLSEWHERQQSGKTLPIRACAITFDDGWRDNYEYALPILSEKCTPATVFAVAEMIGTARRFWPNRIAHLIKYHQRELIELAEADWLGTHLRTLEHAAERERMAAVIAICKQMSDAELEHRLNHLEPNICTHTTPAPALMDWEQLREMSSSGHIEIGSHTNNHLRLLPSLDTEITRREIVGSKTLLETKLDRPIRTFCYPNGDTSDLALRIVRENYTMAVTTQRGINNARTRAHQLHRIGVHEDTSSTRNGFLASLSGLR